jgi:hypothetical protein
MHTAEVTASSAAIRRRMVAMPTYHRPDLVAGLRRKPHAGHDRWHGFSDRTTAGVSRRSSPGFDERHVSARTSHRGRRPMGQAVNPDDRDPSATTLDLYSHLWSGDEDRIRRAVDGHSPVQLRTG